MFTVTVMTDDDVLFRKVADCLDDTSIIVRPLPQWRIKCPSYDGKSSPLLHDVEVFFKRFSSGDILVLDVEEQRFHPLGLWRYRVNCFEVPVIIAVVSPDLPPTEIMEGFYNPPFEMCYRRDATGENFKEMLMRLIASFRPNTYEYSL